MNGPRTYWTARELMADQFPPPKWAVPGVIPAGLTLLAGAPKVGKSWLALHLGLAVAAGGKALGRIDLQQGPVVALCLEDTGRRLQSRLDTLLLGEQPPIGLHLHTRWPAVDQGGVEALDDWCQKVAPRLIIVDVLKMMRPTARARDSAYDADYAAITPLKTVADEHDTAIVVLHHTRKAAADDPFDTISGTQGLAGAADTSVILRRSRGQADCELHVTGRDVDEAEYGLKIDLRTGTFQLLDGPVSELRMADTRRQIAEHLRDRGEQSPKDVAKALDLDHDLARQTLRRMVNDGQLEQAGRGRYRPLSRVTTVTESLPFGVVSDNVTDVTPADAA